jgi:hypothetical protein
MRRYISIAVLIALMLALPLAQPVFFNGDNAAFAQAKKKAVKKKATKKKAVKKKAPCKGGSCASEAASIAVCRTDTEPFMLDLVPGRVAAAMQRAGTAACSAGSVIILDESTGECDCRQDIE